MKKGKTIYIASSWKNEHGVTLLTAALRAQGHEVLSWIENNYGEGVAGQSPADFERWVNSDQSRQSFRFDTEGAYKCDVFIYYGPAGKDAAAECGIAWASVFFRKTPLKMFGLYSKGEDFGLMRKMFDRWFRNIDELLVVMEEMVESVHA